MLSAHDPIPGNAKRRLNHQPLNQKDRALLLPMAVLLSSEIIYYITPPPPVCQAYFFPAPNPYSHREKDMVYYLYIG